MKESIKFIRVREVHVPTRANAGDAGIDFYIPTNLNLKDLLPCNANSRFSIDYRGNIKQVPNDKVSVIDDSDKDQIKSFIIGPHTTLVIPSGIRAIIEPLDSELHFDDKSGKASGLNIHIYGGVIDSGYTGEMHFVIENTTSHQVEIKAGDKICQAIHRPIYLDTPEEITLEKFRVLAEAKKQQSGRGDAGMGSGKETL